jgi:ribosome-binding protein aMBF1 (putative translation factor)
MGQFEQFGRLLREQLAARGWNASDLGRALQMHRSVVNRWVNGETLPDRENVPRIADALMLSSQVRQQLFNVWFGDA